ncbi:MAG TPA: HEAT repeat domain-containing protein [Gemmataceae bacterium]|nr:HEAT repeat domain-containing protein [Gemmataceae bacterium]
MHTPRWPLALVVLLLAAAVRAEPPAALDTAADEKLLREAGVKTDGPALVEFFRKRLPAEVTPEKLAAFVKQLGDESFDVREKASADLRALGVRALPALRRAAEDPDAEVKRRAEDCIAATVSGDAGARTAAAARLLAARKPAGAAAALVGHLPFAEDDAASDEIVRALIAVGAPDGKVDAAVSDALSDKDPARRAAAALLLGRHGSAEQKAAVRKLLADADLAIRLRAAQGLLANREKAAVPVLLALLGEAPTDVARQAEDLLNRAGGEAAPAVTLGESKEQRAKCRAAWEGWWKEKESKLDLAKADVDLQVINPAALAKETARKMMDAWFLKKDVATAKRLSDAPFSIGGTQKFETRAKVDQFLDEVQQRFKDKKGTGITYRQAVTVDEYLRDTNRTFAEQEAGELAKLRKAELRVVYVDLAYDGRKEAFGVYVRVSGSPRVLGLGPLTARGAK